MNFGAKVLDDWWVTLAEFDLCIASCNGAKLDPLGGENDWLRLCVGGAPVPEGEVMVAVLGFTLGTMKPGERDGDPLSKGLLRHRALLGPAVDMLRVSLCRFYNQTVGFSIFLRSMMLQLQSRDRLKARFLGGEHRVINIASSQDILLQFNKK